MRLLPFLLCCTLSACSAKTGEVKGTKLSTVEAFCSEWAKRACNAAVVDRCSAASADACREKQSGFCAGLVADGEYSALTAEECLSAVGKAYEDTELTPKERDVVRRLGGACDRIRSGSGGVDAPCGEPADCNRDIELTCVAKGGGTAGTCQEPVVVMGGFDCSAKDAVCVEGFFCDDENCIRGEAEGDACNLSTRCAEDLQCVGVADADGGPLTATCEPRGGVGSDCSTDDDCVSRICSPRAGAPTGLCTADIVLAPTDPTCIDLQ